MIKISNPVVDRDMHEIIDSNIEWAQFRNAGILITGINSMIGTYLVFLFVTLNKLMHLNANIFGLTRSLSKSKAIFKGCEDYGLKYINQDVTDKIEICDDIDYLFHFAGNASPSSILNDPVGILKANIVGTFNILELAKRKSPRAVLFASTREVYGKTDFESLSETSFGAIDPMESRNCYPESKRAVEAIAKAYFNQYHIPTYSARIAHTFGPGIKIDNDGRVMADFIGDAVAGKDIILTSDGKAQRAFIYITDVILGLLFIILKGKPGEAYNLSNERETFMIRDIAEKICKLSGEEIEVKFTKNNDKIGGYCNYTRVQLDNSKIESLGFKPKVNLNDAIIRTLESFKE